jgi:general secretion pathway protein M
MEAGAVLRSREKAVLLVGGIAAAAILLLSLFVVPSVTKVRSLSRSAAVAAKDLEEVRRQRPELEAMDREVRRKRGQINAQANASESPIARLTSAITEAGFPQSVVSLRSGGTREGEFIREEAFDLRIDNLTYLEALRLIGKLENGPLPVVIRSVRLKSRFDDDKYVDAALRLGFLLPKGPS